MRFLITGGTGAIGPWVTRDLLARGHDVWLYDLRPDFTLLKDIKNDFRLIAGDVTDLAGLMRAVKQTRPERILHLAVFLPLDEAAQPVRAFQVNADGTQSVLEAALAADCDRVVYTSSKASYGPLEPEYGAPGFKRLTEDHCQRPDTLYGITKLTSEHLCQFYKRHYGLDHIILRFPALYGAGRLARHGVFATTSRLLENAMAGQPTRLRTGIDWQTELLYNHDVAHGVVLAALADASKLEHRIFHIGHGEVTSLPQVISAVKTLYPAADIDVGPGGYRPDSCLFDMSRAEHELGYRPRFGNLVDGMRDYVAWMERLDIAPVATPND